MNEFFGSVWWLIVTMGLLITFHEYGHFVVARRCGVKVLKFSIGFGPALWSRFDRHGTQFVVAAIPLGGYVKMFDEREVDGVVGPQALKGAFNRKTVGQRMLIISAGVVMNVLLAAACFVGVYMTHGVERTAGTQRLVPLDRVRQGVQLPQVDVVDAEPVE